MTTEKPKIDKSLFSAFIPTEFVDKVIDGGVPVVGDVVEMVCVYAEAGDGVGLKFRLKAPVVEKSPIILSN